MTRVLGVRVVGAWLLVPALALVACGSDGSPSDTGLTGLSGGSTGSSGDPDGDDTGGTGNFDTSDGGDGPGPNCPAIVQPFQCNTTPGCQWAGGFGNGGCQNAGGGGNSGGGNSGGGNSGGGNSGGGNSGGNEPDPLPLPETCAEIPTPFVCLTTIGCQWQNDACVGTPTGGS